MRVPSISTAIRRMGGVTSAILSFGNGLVGIGGSGAQTGVEGSSFCLSRGLGVLTKPILRHHRAHSRGRLCPNTPTLANSHLAPPPPQSPADSSPLPHHRAESARLTETRAAATVSTCPPARRHHERVHG